MKKIVAVVGARPNYMKMAPILRAAQDPEAPRKMQFVLVHTGQHYDAVLAEHLFADLGLPRADHALGIGPGSHTQQLAAVVTRLEPLLERERPDLVVVVGDVTSTVGAALSASALGIPVAHVEAGLRSFERDMPEERNRVITDYLSEILFTTEASAAENLAREGLGGRQIHFVGNVMIDSLHACLPRARQATILRELGLEHGGGIEPYVLVTLHRPANVDTYERLASLLSTLQVVAEDLPVLFPMHPRTERRLAALGLQERVEPVRRGRTDGPPPRGRIWMLPALGYVEFLRVLADARLVLTDSGGVQEEATALGVPCLTLRERTERPATVTDGTNRVVGTDPARILSETRRALAQPPARPGTPPLWDGHAAERIVAILKDRL